jgi:site-specific DNA-methyltransferase (adenine-specific)
MPRKKLIQPLDKSFEEVVNDVASYTPRVATVFSNKRDLVQPPFTVKGLKMDKQQKMDGLKLLNKIPENSVPLVFFDPQYRTILDRQNYGNEGKGRGKERAELPQMDEKKIKSFIAEIERVLIPSGHLMMWADKYIVCSGINALLEGSGLQLVDMITWNKGRMGMGYRTRRFSEYLVVFQKLPVRAKGVWMLHDIPDVWDEKIENGDKNHTHAKPVGLQRKLIRAVTNEGDIVVDPASGGYSVLKSALAEGRHFLGCDILK